MKFFVSLICLHLLLPGFAMAETLYGSFRYDERMPEALFLTGDIHQGDSFELRKAMRDHGTRIVVMGSAGGNLYEGLQMGSILHDNGIATYVPPDVNCESSCANMFFGGAMRKAEGKLGVHQFYSKDGSQTATLGQAEETTQYTMADMIGIMNDFKTPAFVYEKMLRTTDIYYFAEGELRQIDLSADAPDFVALQLAAKALIAADPAVVSRFGASVSPTEPAPATQDPNVSMSAPPAPPAQSIFEGTDFFGADLSPKGVRGVSLAECEQICRNTTACAAWSYVHETRWCWPKAAVSNISMAVGITSGITDYSRVDPAALNQPFLEVSAADLPGNDLLPRGIPNMSLEGCRQACQSSNTCKAFTWVGKKNLCFPKYGVSTPTKFVGAISGVKR